MKNYFSLLLMALGIGSCSANDGFESVDAETFAGVISDPDVLLLDVRTAEEYAEERIGNAQNIDVLQSDFTERIQTMDRSKTIAVYCRSGRRSKKAANILVENGFKVVELATGNNGWKERYPYPVEQLRTESGKTVTISLINHGSLCIDFDSTNIQIDPVGNFYGRKIDYSAFPKADYIFITHEHGDHLDQATIDALTKDGTKIYLNPASQKQLGVGETLTNGQTIEIDGIEVEAVAAYNTTPEHAQFHPKGNGNGYVFNFDGIRVYVSGDTEDILELAKLKDIDIAFLSANQPYTMTPEQCIKAAKTIGPKILIPYHLGETDMQQIATGLKDTGIDVRLHETLR